MIVSRASPLLRIVSTNSRCSAVERRVEQQLGHADHAIHGRADLVAHIGQKFRLGPVGTGGGGGQLGRRTRGALELGAGRRDLGFSRFLFGDITKQGDPLDATIGA